MDDIVRLDKNNLIEEIERQSSYMGYNCEVLGELDAEILDFKNEISKMKKDLETEKSKLENKIRSGKESRFDMKITEKSVVSYVLAHPKIIEKEEFIYIETKKMNEVIRKRNRLSAKVEALKHKKSCLEMLHTLLLNDFFALPKLRSTKIKEEQKEKSKRRRENR